MSRGLDRIVEDAFAAAKASIDKGGTIAWAAPNWPWELVRQVGPVILVIHARGHDGPTVFGDAKLTVWLAVSGGTRLLHATLYCASVADAKAAADRLLASEIN